MIFRTRPGDSSSSATPLRELRVIATAYACEPHTGSETGIGWNIVREVSRGRGVHVTVITRTNNRPAIERALAADPDAGLRFVYYDLPSWAGWWKRGRRGLQLYYYLWQIGAGRRAAALHAAQRFDCSHHITFGRYWSPSFLPKLGIPFFWGPIGGGESAPDSFLPSLSTRGRISEALRGAARWMGEHDPAVRRAAKSCAVAFATTAETSDRLEFLGVRRIVLLGNAALSRAEYDHLSRLPLPGDGPLRLVSAGRLVHWKGFDLGIRGLAESGLRDAEYWILGDGPSRASLEALARELGVAELVKLPGSVPREDVINLLGRSHALVHPSLHDSGGWSCIEAMAAARPVICLDLGGPAVMVDNESGFKITPSTPAAAVAEVARAITAFATDRGLLRRKGEVARDRVRDLFSWEAKADQITRAYTSVLQPVTV